MSKDTKPDVDTILNNLDKVATTELSKPSILVDYERYEDFLEHSVMTEEEKHQYMQALWGFMFQFALFGFELHPLQEVGQDVGQVCVQLNKKPKNSRNSTSDLVE